MVTTNISDLELTALAYNINNNRTESRARKDRGCTNGSKVN
jgi:hypothetical protein